MPDAWLYENPDKVTFGAIGEPGSRVFLLQVVEGSSIATIKLEKQQVKAIVEYLSKIFESSPRPGHLVEPTVLEEPIEPMWAAGPIAALYEEEINRVFLVAQEFSPDAPSVDDIDDPLKIISNVAFEGFSIRIVMTLEQAGALAISGKLLIESGRPLCPLCSYPLDPRGHDCPKTNGYRPPLL